VGRADRADCSRTSGRRSWRPLPIRASAPVSPSSVEGRPALQSAGRGSTAGWGRAYELRACFGWEPQRRYDRRWRQRQFGRRWRRPNDPRQQRQYARRHLSGRYPDSPRWGGLRASRLTRRQQHAASGCQSLLRRRAGWTACGHSRATSFHVRRRCCFAVALQATTQAHDHRLSDPSVAFSRGGICPAMRSCSGPPGPACCGA